MKLHLISVAVAAYAVLAMAWICYAQVGAAPKEHDILAFMQRG